MGKHAVGKYSANKKYIATIYPQKGDSCISLKYRAVAKGNI